MTLLGVSLIHLKRNLSGFLLEATGGGERGGQVGAWKTPLVGNNR